MHDELKKDDGQQTVILPFVHLNGTSAEELIALRENAYGALDQALHYLQQMAPNGRDYYPDPGRMDKAVAQHDRRCKAINDIRKELEIECEGIQDLMK